MIAFDLDGTLAEYHGWKGVSHIGAPVPKMIDRLLFHIENGDECIIFTSRVGHDDVHQNTMAEHHISKWLRDNDLPYMKITARKLPGIRLFYDDRALHVEKNLGVVI